MTNNNQLSNINTLTERTTGSLLGAAAGDALGWMTEFIRSPEDLKRKMGVDRVTEFLPWNKRVGGRFQGYEDYIAAGDYSDDTQLTICTAACILPNGHFDYRTFCDREYPMWLEYARGAGGTVKEAAKKIQRKSAQWNNNFFTRKIKKRTIDYRDGGANGAAMRISPHVLANINRWQQAEADIWRNTIISHGHPRAIIGAIIYGYALHNALQWSEFSTGQQLIEILGNWIKDLEIPSISGLNTWVREWNKGRNESFQTIFANTKQEAVEQLRLIWQGIYKKQAPQKILKQLGCFDYETKGSGLGTALAGIYLFACQPEKLEENIIIAANAIGSDTDSIAAFVGSLSGAAFGLTTIPQKWLSQTQDKQFLIDIGKHLATISMNINPQTEIRPQIDKKSSRHLSRKCIENNMRIFHRALGLGTITRVDEQALMSKDKTVTIASITFDIGQSCKFPFRTDNPLETIFIK